MGLREYASDWLVVATGVEFALIVATADVDTEGDAGMPIYDRVIHFDAGVYQLVGVAAALNIAFPHFGVEQCRVLGGVNLDVGAAQQISSATS